MKKKRDVERFDLKVPVTIEVLGGSERRILELKTSNISCGGAYFSTRRPLSQGEKVRMRMVLPAVRRQKKKSGKQALIEVKGVVSRSESGGMAISFEDFKMTRQDAEAIRALDQTKMVSK